MSDTFGRIADDELASLIARATGEEDGGKRPHTWGLIRSSLLELEQYRARIAAHAAAHPERLSDATADDLAREIACEQIFEGVGLDVEDANETRADPNVGIWVTVRVLVKDEAIGSYRETKSFLEGFK